ncbi:hypothetical protein GCM10023191_057490 [Actinoallomurus oryzae]|uniref:Solute-binding protein family 5 domain-containing protein n=1 Tax=Actinoallomurus oryzae TaxID=502180 RepID=A0ABP8QIF5_9ACTN
MAGRLGTRAAMGCALGLVAALLAACGGGAASTGTGGAADPDAALRVGFPVTQTLDPALTPGAAAMLSSTWPVYDRLLQVSEDARYEPMLAEKWRFSADGRTLTLDLRRGVTFSDGTKFDADAVRANIDRYKTAPAVAESSASIATVDVVSDYVVKLHLRRPTRAVLNALAAPAPGAMISPTALNNRDLATRPVGTGAWVIDTFRPGQQVTYKRRTDSAGIWDGRTGKVARVEITSRSTDAAYAAVRSGQADIVLSSGDDSELRSEIVARRLRLRALPTTMTIAGMFMNQTVRPFDDKRVRQAVNYAIDRASIVKAFAPTTSPRVQPFPKVLGGFDPAPRQLVTYYGRSGAPGMFTYITFPSIESGADFTWLYDNPLTMPGGVPTPLVAKFAGADDPGVSGPVRASRAAAVNRYATANALYAPVWQGVPGYIITARVRGLDEGQGFLAPYGAEDFRYVSLTR